MKFYIETDRTVGVTGDLTTQQADRFYEWARKKGVFSFLVSGLGGQVLVVISVGGMPTVAEALNGRFSTEKEFEKEAEYGCWGRDDAKLWDNIKRLDGFFEKYRYVTLVKIYPESAVLDDVPDDFIEKEQICYEDLKKLEDRGKRKPVIADYLQAAERISGLYKDKVKKALPQPSTTTSKQKNKNAQQKGTQTRNKGSEYYEAVKERFGVLERVVKGIRALEEGTDERELAPDVLGVIDVLGEREEEGENKYGILLDMLKPKNIAQYLKDNNDRFRGEKPTLDSVEKGVERALDRNGGELKRIQCEIEESVKGTPPPLADESLEEWGSEISPDDKNKEKYEQAVEDYFISFRGEALVKGTPRSEYISNVRALTLDVVAKHLKENAEVFKNWKVSSISTWLKNHSVEWKNRLLTLDVENSDCDTNYDADSDGYDAD